MTNWWPQLQLMTWLNLFTVPLDRWTLWHCTNSNFCKNIVLPAAWLQNMLNFHVFMSSLEVLFTKLWHSIILYVTNNVQQVRTRSPFPLWSVCRIVSSPKLSNSVWRRSNSCNRSSSLCCFSNFSLFVCFLWTFSTWMTTNTACHLTSSSVTSCTELESEF